MLKSEHSTAFICPVLYIYSSVNIVQSGIIIVANVVGAALFKLGRLDNKLVSVPSSGHQVHTAHCTERAHYRDYPLDQHSATALSLGQRSDFALRFPPLFSRKKYPYYLEPKLEC